MQLLTHQKVDTYNHTLLIRAQHQLHFSINEQSQSIKINGKIPDKSLSRRNPVTFHWEIIEPPPTNTSLPLGEYLITNETSNYISVPFVHSRTGELVVFEVIQK